MFRWTSGWHGHLRPCDIAGMLASAVLLGSFIVLATVAIYAPNERFPGARALAVFGLCALVARAATQVWEYHENKKTALR